MWNSKTEKQLAWWVWRWLSNSAIASVMETSEDSIRNKIKRMWLKKVVKIDKPRILFLDIETAPIVSYTWWTFDQNIWIKQIKEDWFILCWSARWGSETRPISDSVTVKEVLKKDDSRIVDRLWHIMDEADIIIGQNIDKFDIKKINARFIKYWLWFPSSYQTIDTLKIARKYFSITSNKLDYLCRFLGLPWKIDTGWFELWSSCLDGDRHALDLMEQYCSNDVIILWKLYERLKQYAEKEYERIEKRFTKICQDKKDQEVITKVRQTKIKKH
jgi:hypothetical protein